MDFVRVFAIAGLAFVMASGAVAGAHERPNDTKDIPAVRPSQSAIATKNELSSAAAIQIAQHGCKSEWKASDDQWAARREGTEWHVWLSFPDSTDPFKNKTSVVLQVWMDARSGAIRECLMTDD